MTNEVDPLVPSKSRAGNRVGDQQELSEADS